MHVPNNMYTYQYACIFTHMRSVFVSCLCALASGLICVNLTRNTHNTHTHIHASTPSHTLTYMQAHPYTHTHTHTHTHAYTHTREHIRTHTHIVHTRHKHINRLDVNAYMIHKWLQKCAYVYRYNVYVIRRYIQVHRYARIYVGIMHIYLSNANISISLHR